MAEVCPLKGLVCAKMHVDLARRPSMLLEWHQPLGEAAGEERLLRPLRPYPLGTPAPLRGKVKGVIIREADTGRRMCWRGSQASAAWGDLRQ